MRQFWFADAPQGRRSTSMREFGLVLLCLLRISRKGVQSNSWSVHVPSDVTGELGKMVILPCTFTHPYKAFDRTLTAIWRIKEPYNGTIVFKCVSQSTNELCKTAISYKNKYKLLGNPRHKDLSIRIDNLTWSDSDRYFCRVELAGDIHDKYESRSGIKLHLIDKGLTQMDPSMCVLEVRDRGNSRESLVESTTVAMSSTLCRCSESKKVTTCAYDVDGTSLPSAIVEGLSSWTAPRIINITVSSNRDHTFQARCTAEGEPAPALTWTGPPYPNLTSTTSTSHRVTKELRYLTHDGKYTCTAVNSHGRAEGAVYFYKFKASDGSFFMILVLVPLGVKVLVLVAILSFTVFSREGPSSAPSSLVRTQLPDCTYENFDRRHGGNQTLPGGRAVPRRS